MTSRAKVVLLDQFDGSVEQAELDDLAVVEWVDPFSSRAEQLKACADADAILLGLSPIDRDFMASLRQCKVIARYGMGIDNIDLDAAREFGIRVTNVTDFCIDEVATHAITLALAMVRRLPEAVDLVRNGGWGFTSLGAVHRLSALQFGVVGYGQIGRRTAELARALGFRVVVASRSGRGVDPSESLDLDELLATSDVVSLHVPLSPETRNLLDPQRIGSMKRSAILVNTGRGALVDLPALIQALEAGALGGAALDVLPEEPPVFAEINDVPNLIVTPHYGFYSQEAMQQMRRSASDEVRRALTGQPAKSPVL